MAAAVLTVTAAPPLAAAQPQAVAADRVQITATRFGDTVQEVPMAIEVVTGADLRARGAIDLRTALAQLRGVSVAPGGDAGPAASVPGLLGTREIDDLLLLVDGVPAGGAFTPQTEAVSLVNVERIEILRGTAPVYFGTTAFAGTINVIHYAAGRAEQVLSVRAGSFGSVAASASAVLSTGVVRQSISGEFSDDRFSGNQQDNAYRAGAKRAQGNWRLATDIGDGQLRIDVNLMSLKQKPASPTPEGAEGNLNTALSPDFNQNPANAKIDTNHGQLVLGFDLPTGAGRWGSTVSFSASRTAQIRGFIDIGDSPPPWNSTTAVDLEAFQQRKVLKDLFLDSHLTTRAAAGLDLTAGVNVLLGRANARSLRYAHQLVMNGSDALPDIEAVAPKTDVELDDTRRFIGLYAQSRYQLAPALSLLAGLRWNDTHEEREETRITLSRNTTTHSAAVQDNRRLSGSLGLQWKAFDGVRGAINGMTFHASVGNTFQPAQIDFNPNPEAKPEGGGLLKPETQRSLVMGLRADALGGMAEFDIDAFLVDFNGQPITATVGTASVLRPEGRQRYQGADFEGKLRPMADLTLNSSLGYSSVRYRDFVTDVDGAPTQLSGNQLVLTPRWRAGAGVTYAPRLGLTAGLTASWTGQRWLNRLNTVPTPAYTVVDASLGWRFEGFAVQFTVSNLGNRRDPVAQSELGDDQFYRLPARRMMAAVSMPL